MQNNIILVNKKIGETPLEVVGRVKLANPHLSSEKIAYAGRLDPMAKGLMILLVGEECKKRDLYQDMDKIYEFDLLLGIETDTYDALGMINSVNNSEKIAIDQVQKSLVKFTGEIKQKYPPYSSFHVNGKPLYWYAREKLLNTIEIPTKLVTVTSLEILDYKLVSPEELLRTVRTQIESVKGNFRQKEILKVWVDKLSNLDFKFVVVKMKAEVTSGTYIRSICDSIGKELSVGGIAMDINRIRVGKYNLSDII